MPGRKLVAGDYEFEDSKGYIKQNIFMRQRTKTEKTKQSYYTEITWTRWFARSVESIFRVYTILLLDMSIPPCLMMHCLQFSTNDLQTCASQNFCWFWKGSILLYNWTEYAANVCASSCTILSIENPQGQNGVDTPLDQMANSGPSSKYLHFSAEPAT